MTERLYYTDAYTLRFEARILERTTHEGHPALVLDGSYFYPTSGGQPHDTGTINAVPVLDVFVRETDQAVVHVLAEDVPGPEVSASIDRARRFDHMQHHTGQHILTRAFIDIAGTNTVSFHLGAENVTIDLDCASLTDAQIAAAEDLANAIVTQDLPVQVWFPTPEEQHALELRKVPEVNGKLRVVRIGDFDATACGGTHVARTGEVGLIKVLRTEKYKNMVRVEFRCGSRALHDYQEKNAILLALAADLTTGYTEIGDAIEKLRAENKALRADLRAARQALLVTEAAELLAGMEPANGVRVIAAAWADRDPAELRPLASHLVATPGTVALLGIAGEKASLIAARSPELDGLDMVAALRVITGALSGEGGRGGGRPDFAQGGGIRAELPALKVALAEAAAELRAAVATPGPD